MTLIDKAEAHDDDLIRRGDALAAVKAHDFRWEAADAIAALPARGVGVKPLEWQPTYDGAGNRHRVTVAYCPVFKMNLYAERPEDQPRVEAKRAARILAALEPAPTDAAQARQDDTASRRRKMMGHMDDKAAAQVREAAFLGVCECGMTGPCMWDQCKHPLTRETRT